MEHREVEDVLQLFFDAELDTAASLEVERHIAVCLDCTARLKAWQALRKAVTAPSMIYVPPRGLEARVRSSVRRIDRPASPLQWRLWPIGAIAAACILFVILIIRILPSGPGSDDPLIREILQSHVRSLMPGHLTDVTSTDQHTVKPWFNGRVDFSPPVKDLSADGFPLLGGRLDYVDGRTVAVLVYQRRKHLINLFTWPAQDTAGSAMSSFSRQGFHILTWQSAGMVCNAVSDLDAQELEEFAGILRK